MKDISERFPVAADHHLKNTGRHPEDTEMAIPYVRSHEILEVQSYLEDSGSLRLPDC